MFYFIRHGSTDYSERNTKIYQDFGVNLAPLSPEGVQQIKASAKDSRLQGADIILSSPYTRALQTAAILSRELCADIIVETDLHEWMANKHYLYETDEKAEISYHEFLSSGGVYPSGEEKEWEDCSSMKKRAMAVLDKYREYNKVIVACHGMLIEAVCDVRHPANGEIVELNQRDSY